MGCLPRNASVDLHFARSRRSATQVKMAPGTFIKVVVVVDVVVVVVVLVSFAVVLIICFAV